MTIIGQLVLTFGLLSLLSIGGANATIPEIHRQVVDVLHWMDDTTFANLIAIGQTAPGPNVLVVSMIGGHMAGISGLLAATLAIIVPSGCLAFILGRAMTRYAASEWIGLAKRALAPIAVGLMVASGAVMTQSSYVSELSLAIVATVAALIYLTHTSPFWGIFAGALIGIVGHGLHAFG